MTLPSFEHLVLRIANQTPTRYWRWYNHPNEPKVLAVAFEASRESAFVNELCLRGLDLEKTEYMPGWPLMTIQRTDQ